jgi:hypothetical protein
MGSLHLQVIEEELGQPVNEIFSEISELPVAAASLGQVRSPAGPVSYMYCLYVICFVICICICGCAQELCRARALHARAARAPLDP